MKFRLQKNFGAAGRASSGQNGERLYDAGAVVHMPAREKYARGGVSYGVYADDTIQSLGRARSRVSGLKGAASSDDPTAWKIATA